MKYVIIGLGVSGLTAAKTIRGLDPDAEIHIFTDESSLYYPRPKLFDVIYEKVSARDIYYYDSFWYAENRIKLHLGSGVRKVNAKEHSLLLEDGGTVTYDKLLIANGASSFVPPIKGVHLAGIFTLRNLDDAFRIKKHSFIIGNNKPVVVIGGGVLGLEAAHSFRMNKLMPVVIEASPYLLPRQLDKEGGDILKGIFENWGIEIKTDYKTEEFLGNDSVKEVLLANGTKVKALMVLLSTGVRSNLSLLELSNLPHNKGAIVDDYMMISDDIYASGDVAEYKGLTYGIIPPAIEQGTVAGKNMVKHGSAEYKGSIPTNTLKIAGFDFTSVGNINPQDETGFEIIRAKAPVEGKYRKVVLKDSKVEGVIILGLKGEAVAANRLVNQKVDVSSFKDKLSDIDFSLKSIGKA
ncbi:MAG: NAD(P)/FAD-dependent oxidoreductase [Caldisericaceae bacterium]